MPLAISLNRPPAASPPAPSAAGWRRARGSAPDGIRHSGEKVTTLGAGRFSCSRRSSAAIASAVVSAGAAAAEAEDEEGLEMREALEVLVERALREHQQHLTAYL